MKKLLLGLGTLSLAILPVVAVVSCSSTETPAPTLDSQVKKFETAVVTKTPTTSATDAAKTISDAQDAAAKLKALEVFATLPKLDSGFTLEVKSATVDTTVKSQVNVTVTITQTNGTAGSNTKDAVLKVSGLALSTLTIEAKKFTDFTGTAKDANQTVAAAAATITDASGAAAKLAALQALTATEIPTVVAGFSFEVKSAAADTTTNTTLNVTISVSQTGNNTPVEATLTITGFATPTAGQTK